MFRFSLKCYKETVETVFMCVPVYMCVGVWELMSVYMYMLVYILKWGDQKSMICIILCCFQPSCFLKQDISLNLKIRSSVKLANQLATEMCPPPTPTQHWRNTCVLPQTRPCLNSRNLNSGLHSTKIYVHGDSCLPSIWTIWIFGK